MTESQKMFEAWFKTTNQTLTMKDWSYRCYQQALQHQQQRIEELERKRIEADKRATKYAFQNDVMALRLGKTESKLKIAVDALKFCSDCKHYNNEPTGKVVLVDYGCKADEALNSLNGVKK
jgi:hypothetical protein